MLQQMRENTKTILWIVVITFIISIFAVWGMNLKSGRGSDPALESDVIGSVDGEKITRQMYSSAYQEIYNQVRAQRGENVELSVTERNMLNEQAWETLVMEILRNREIQRMGITVSDNELVAFLRQNPPAVLQQAFADEQGRFDYQAYLRELSNPQRDWTTLEQWGRAQLPRMKFETMLVSQIHVPERIIFDEFGKQTVEMKAQFVKVPYAEENPPYTPDDQQIKSLYDKSMDEYKEFEKRKVRLIGIPFDPTEADEREVREQLLEIRKEIAAGTDFAEAARLHSDDYNSAENGGDLGFFARGALDSTFTEVAFSQAAGQISGPVRTSYGYHLIRTEEKKQEDGEEKVRASHILMKVEPGYDTTDSLSTLFRDLDEAIRNEGFEKGAASKGLVTIDTEPFIKGAFIKGLGYQPRIVNFAFNHEPGTVSSAIQTEDATYFVKVLERMPEKTRSLEEVRDLVVEKIKYERKVSRAEKIAETIKQDALAGGNLETAARAMGFELLETPPFKIADEIPGIGAGSNFAMACYELPSGRISVPVKGQNEWFVIRVQSKSLPDLNEFAKQKDQIRNEMMQQASYDFLSEWYGKLRETADIVDDREETID